MNGGGGLFFTGGFTGFGNGGGGGGTQMSGSSSQTTSPLQQQLFHIGEFWILHHVTGHVTLDITVKSASDVFFSIFSASSLRNRASANARHAAAALLEYCSTGNPRVLLTLQRHLCGVQDTNGDT